MKQFIVALAVSTFAIGAACAQVPAAPAAPDAPVATPVHKKAAPAPRHKKAPVKKDRTKKAASS
jgi:hypothetical protein